MCWIPIYNDTLQIQLYGIELVLVLIKYFCRRQISHTSYLYDNLIIRTHTVGDINGFTIVVSSRNLSNQQIFTDLQVIKSHPLSLKVVLQVNLHFSGPSLKHEQRELLGSGASSPTNPNALLKYSINTDIGMFKAQRKETKR